MHQVHTKKEAMRSLAKLFWMLGVLILISGGITTLVLARGGTVPVVIIPTPIPVLAVTTLSGVVKDAKGPVAGATVRIQASENKATTGADGTFTLQGVSGTQPLTVTASAVGYYINWAKVQPGIKNINLTLTAHFATDNVDYNWFVHDGIKGSAACGLCHTVEELHTSDPKRTMANQLYYGDNLQVLRDSVSTESVDLVYLDQSKREKLF